MTSKEKLLTILKKYKLADKGNGDFLREDYQEELLNPIFKDLEDYEELLKIMGTPIEKIMKRLKVLEILKKSENESGMKDYHFDYYTFFVERESEDYKIIEDWWWKENDKNNR